LVNYLIETSVILIAYRNSSSVSSTSNSSSSLSFALPLTYISNGSLSFWIIAFIPIYLVK
jgi:hypothetical protein